MDRALSFRVPASRWSQERARDLAPAELLLYRSNLLGADLTVTNFGGGQHLGEAAGPGSAEWRAGGGAVG
jgi:hypothetical protein